MNSDRNILTQFIKNTFPISEYAAKLIADNFEYKIFPKNTLTLQAGKVNSDYIFLEDGFMRSYIFDTEGNEVTTNIYKPKQMIFEVGSYFQRIPSTENIETLTSCSTWVGKYDSFQNLFHSLPEFREFGRAILVKGYISFKERTISMINEKAEQRYEKLLKDSPEIFQHVPLKYIASYLGITDTSLSRLRKELLKK